MLKTATTEEIAELHKTSKGNGYWASKVWPTCGEASITWIRKPGDAPGPDDPGYDYWLKWKEEQTELRDNDNEQRAVRRAQSAVRRYCRHNNLNQMVTFTFRGTPPEFDSLSACVENFWRRWERKTKLQRGPYVWVPEWGKVTGRLHIHMAVPWWRELNCVEVCPHCDRYNVLTSHDRRVHQNYLCCGCLWGHGFVGRPLDDEGNYETNEEGRALSRYLSKYMAKDLGSELERGQQRYRSAEGHAPPHYDGDHESPDEAIYFATKVVNDIFKFHEEPPIMFVM